MKHTSASLNRNIIKSYNGGGYRPELTGTYSFEMGGRTHYFDDRDEYLRALENFLRVQHLQELNHGRVSEEMRNDTGFDLEENINDSDKEDWTPAGGEDEGDLNDYGKEK